MTPQPASVSVALACGGTGGHLFPGLAIAQELADRGARVALFVSPKEVDQQGAQAAVGRFEVVTLPLVAFSGRRAVAFWRGTWRGYREAGRHFAQSRPAAVLAMGGFTSVVPVLAGRRAGALTFLHESNAVPGRANRWLARLVDECLVGFAAAAPRLAGDRVSVTGTPVRAEIRRADPGAARAALGLAPARPVLLVTGGSQGARGVNQLMLAALPEIGLHHPGIQFVHLTGEADFREVEAGYRSAGLPAVVQPFSHRMDQMLAAATAAVSRSGASSLAELAARRVPAVLVPYPSAADDHQRHNARVFVEAGAARMLDQTTADGPRLAAMLRDILENPALRSTMAEALARLDAPEAASEIATRIWNRLADRPAPGPRSRRLDPVNPARDIAPRAA